MAKKRLILWIIFAVAAVALVSGPRFARTYHEKQEKACIESVKAQYQNALAKYKPSFISRTEQSLDEEKEVRKTAATMDVPPPPLLIPLALIDLSFIEKILDDFNCYYVPLPIGPDWKLVSYDKKNLPSPPCKPAGTIASPDDFNKTLILEYSKRVGRLAIQRSNYEPSFWGTGFLIAPGILATPCHVIAPLLDKSGHLEKDEKLMVDFETTGRPPADKREFEVTNATCSARTGFDVALLDLCASPGNCPKSLPKQPLPLFVGQFKQVQYKLSALVGYADLDHFIDPDRRDIYAPWIPRQGQDPLFSKFVVGDIVASDDACGNGSDIILDTDITTLGESGSPVIDLRLEERGKAAEPVVIGMHTCCSAYFEYDQGKPPEPDLKCARLRRTFHNQDISSWSMLKDPSLCPILRDRGAIAINQEGQQSEIKCSPR